MMKLKALATIIGVKDLDGKTPVGPGKSFEIADAEGQVLVSQKFATEDNGNTADDRSQMSQAAQLEADRAAAKLRQEADEAEAKSKREAAERQAAADAEATADRERQAKAEEQAAAQRAADAQAEAQRSAEAQADAASRQKQTGNKRN